VSFLGPVASDGANDGVLLSANAVSGTLSVTLGLGSLVLGLSSSVLLLARALPAGSAGQVTNALNDVALGRVELSGSLAIKFVNTEKCEELESNNLGSL